MLFTVQNLIMDFNILFLCITFLTAYHSKQLDLSIPDSK